MISFTDRSMTEWEQKCKNLLFYISGAAQHRHVNVNKDLKLCFFGLILSFFQTAQRVMLVLAILHGK